MRLNEYVRFRFDFIPEEERILHYAACDVAAFPHEYDRMTFRTFVYKGPATTADFIVSDACNIVATATVGQTATYATGTSAEIAQLEKNYFSYQSPGPKHLHRQPGYNPFFESYVSDGSVYDTFYIKFKTSKLIICNKSDIGVVL